MADLGNHCRVCDQLGGIGHLDVQLHAVDVLAVRILGHHVTAAPGWYPDPADPRCLRWWNGTGWTDRVGPPAFQPTPTQRPLLGKDQGVENPFIWVIACLPFGVGAMMLTWSVEVRPYINSNGYASIDPGYVFSNRSLSCRLCSQNWATRPDRPHPHTR
ncbi:DUF2510 domain-containing protein [Paenarthrobacter nicotinovorans]|uniref:DUF2510 domain-containing protein n=1 Tax=Paenarthrobacter nicotinovorans TaxID=29320 RepID=UPI0027D24C50|nr:DUF2510 domain-containing protein [Paenarthrobacter nicotinovorans]